MLRNFAQSCVKVHKLSATTMQRIKIQTTRGRSVNQPLQQLERREVDDTVDNDKSVLSNILDVSHAAAGKSTSVRSLPE